MDLPEEWNKSGVYACFNKVRAFDAPARVSRHPCMPSRGAPLLTVPALAPEPVAVAMGGV
jgi:hypothetical protein